jgi:hypothetical protein
LAITDAPSRPAPPLAAELLTMVTNPSGTFPLLLARNRTFEVLFFPAVSGVYVAYAAAEKFHLGDYFGFAMTAAGVLMLGLALGLLALAFIAYVLAWSTDRAGGTADIDDLGAVFGYATWPFLPLLMIIVPIELTLYGTDLFSASRAPGPGFIPELVTVLELTTIAVWLFLVLRGEAVTAHLSNAEAARTLGLTIVRLAAIGLLLAIVMFVSFMI